MKEGGNSSSSAQPPSSPVGEPTVTPVDESLSASARAETPAQPPVLNVITESPGVEAPEITAVAPGLLKLSPSPSGMFSTHQAALAQKLQKHKRVAEVQMFDMSGRPVSETELPQTEECDHHIAIVQGELPDEDMKLGSKVIPTGISKGPDIQMGRASVPEVHIIEDALFSTKETPKVLPPEGTRLGKFGCPLSFPGRWGRLQGAVCVPLVLAAIGSSYMAVVFYRKEYSMSVWVELAVFHLLWVPMMISWLHCVLLDPGSLDQEWKAYLQETFSTEGSSVNYCTKSNLFKPPRAHFCRMSERLILNMDHFCPWIGNTVGFCNRKFFILFLFYTCLTCSFAAISFAVRIGRCYIDEDHEGCGYMIWLKVVFVKDFVLAVVLGRFGAFHWQMACQNETSIERLLNSKPEYDLSRSDNLRQVFGLEKWSWFVPLSCGGPSIDGISWPTRELTSEEIAKRSKSANSI